LSTHAFTASWPRSRIRCCLPRSAGRISTDFRRRIAFPTPPPIGCPKLRCALRASWSDYDLRGAHVLPLDAVVGLEVRDETVQDERVIDGLEMDIVSHDVKKFFGLLLKTNGYVLEQLYSPLIVHTTPEHEGLKEIFSYRSRRRRRDGSQTESANV